MSDLLRLQSKTAVVTGGSRGVGKATALLLADAGVSVGIGFRSRADEARDTVEALKEKGAVLKAKASELREINRALRVLMKQRNEDRKELEEKILSNVKTLVAPYIDKLKKSGLDSKQMTYLGILQSILNDIISPFVHTLSSQSSSLTPTEIQTAQLIKEGGPGPQ